MTSCHLAVILVSVNAWLVHSVTYQWKIKVGTQPGLSAVRV